MAIKVYKGGSWVNTTGVSAIGKADRLSIGQTDTSLATSDKNYYLSFVDSNHPHTSRQYEDFYTGIGITFSPITKSLSVDGILYLNGQDNNSQGSIWSKGGADKRFVLYNNSNEGETSIVVANSSGSINTGIATFKRGAAAADDDSYFRSNVSPPKDCTGIYNLGKPEEKWNNVYANCFIGCGAGLDGTGHWDEDVYKNLKAGTCAGAGIVEKTCYNIFVGAYAGCKTTGASGANETAIDEVGDANVFLGIAAGRCNTTGSRNFYGGYAAGRGKTDSTSTGEANVFIGRSAGQEINTGNNNTFLGKLAGLKIDSGDNNIILGTCAGYYTSSASQVTSIGVFAGHCNNTANNGVFLGTYAGRNVTSGAGNVAVGMNALRGEDGVNITGALNVALGYAAGRTLGTVSGEVLGQGNVFLGATAAENQTSGDFNVAIGYGVCLANTTSGGQLAIGVADKTWISGDSCFNIKPGRGIIDCAGSCGAAGQVLTSQQVAGTEGNPNDYYVKWDANVSNATNADKVGIGTTTNAGGDDVQDYYVPFVRDNNPHNSRDYEQLYSGKLVYRYQASNDSSRVGINTDIVGQELNVYSKQFSGIRVKSARIASAPLDTMTQIGGLQFADSDHTSFNNGRTMSAIVGTVGGDLILKTGHDATDNGSIDRVTITPLGHVGIGTTNPIAENITTALDVNTKVLAVGIVTAKDYYGTFRGTIDASADIVTDKIKASEGTYAQVVDTGTDGHFKVLTEGSERFRIASGGMLIKGNTESVGQIETQLNQQNQFHGNDRKGGIRITDFSDSTFSASLEFVKSRNATIGQNTILQDGDRMGSIYWGGANGTNFQPGAFLTVRTDGTVSSTSMPTVISFGTNEGNNILERLRIGSSGQIGLSKDVDGTWTNDFGTDNQVLTSKGGSAAAVWQTISGIPASEANKLKITKTVSKTELYLLGVENESDETGTTITKTVYQKTQNTLFFDTSNDTLHVPKIIGEEVASGTWPAGVGDLTIQTNHLIPSGNATINSQGIVIEPLLITNGGSTYGASGTNVATSGGTGSNLTVDFTSIGGVINAVTINTAGTGYAVNDTITVSGGGGNATFKITAVDTTITGGQNLGSETKKWANVYAQKFVGALGGTADSTDQIKVQKNEDAGNAHYFGMVNGAGEKGFPSNQTVYTDTALTYLPSNDTLTALNIEVTTKLHVKGNTILGDSATQDTIKFTGKVDSAVLPKVDAEDTDPLTTGYDLGGSGAYWRTIYAREFKGSVVGDATSAKTLNIGTDNTAADRYLTFVAASGDGKDVYMDSELKYNSNTNTLTPVNLSVTGDTTLGTSLAGEDPDTTIFNSHVTSHIIPGGTLTSPGDYTSYNLGESTRKWNTVYAENFSGSFTGSIEKIKTTKSENQETTYLTFTTTTPDDENRDSSLFTNPHLYFRSASTSPGEKLTVDCQLDVTGDATFSEDVTLGALGEGGTTDDIVTFNSKVASHIFPSHSATGADDISGKDLGDSNNYWRKVYARDYAGTFTGTITSRNIAMSGDVVWNVDFDASANVTAVGTIQPAAVDESMLNITDAPASGNVGYFLKLVDENGTLNWAQVSGTGSSLKFTDLTDTPNEYASNAGDKNKLVAVNNAGTALIFTDASNVGTDTYVTDASWSAITGGKQLQLTRNNDQPTLTANLTLSDLGGVNKFLDLTDVTPTSYEGQAHKFVRVNKPNSSGSNVNDGSGLEFVDVTGLNGDFSFIGLSDTPANWADNEGDKDKYVRVNTTGNGLVFDTATISAGTVDLGKTSDINNNQWHFVFADSRDGGSETLYVENESSPPIKYNNDTDQLQIANLYVVGNTTLGDTLADTDTVTWNAKSTTILPSGDLTNGVATGTNLGSATCKWDTIHANIITGTLTVNTSDTQVLYTSGTGANAVAAGTDNFTYVETTPESGNHRSTLNVTNSNSNGSGGIISAASKDGANGVAITCDGGIEILRSIKATGTSGGAYIDWKDVNSSDYDARIQLATNAAEAGWDAADKGGLLFETGGENRHMLLTKNGVLGITTYSGHDAIMTNSGDNHKNYFVPGVPRDADLNDAHNIDNRVVLDVNGTLMLRANFENGQTIATGREGAQLVLNNSDDTVGFSVDVYGSSANNSSLRIIDEKEPQDNRGTQRFAMNRGGAITFKTFSGGETGRSNADIDYGLDGYVLTSKGVGDPPLWEPAPAGASALKAKVRYHQGGFLIYTPTTNTKFIRVQVIGPGGGGGGLNTDPDDDTLSGSGGGGGYCEAYITIAGNSNLGTMVYQSATGGTGGTTGGSDGATGSISMFWTSYGTANQICMKACGGQGGEGSHNADANQLSGNGGEALYDKGTTATGGVISVYDSANPPSGGELPDGLDFIYLSKGAPGVNNYTTKKRYTGPPSGITYQSWDIDGGGSNGMGGYTYGYGGHGCFDNESYNRVGGNGTDGIVIVTEFGDF